MVLADGAERLPTGQASIRTTVNTIASPKLPVTLDSINFVALFEASIDDDNEPCRIEFLLVDPDNEPVFSSKGGIRQKNPTGGRKDIFVVHEAKKIGIYKYGIYTWKCFIDDRLQDYTTSLYVEQ